MVGWLDELFITPLTRMHYLVPQFFFVQFGLLIFSFVFVCCHIHEFIIMTKGLSLRCLMFQPEMPAATFFTMQGILHHKLTQFNEISNPSCFLKFLVEFTVASGYP